MTTKNTGGPAFPVPDYWDEEKSRRSEAGMSIRDYAAIKIAAAAVTNATGLGNMEYKDRADVFTALSSLSYELADAMIEARDK